MSRALHGGMLTPSMVGRFAVVLPLFVLNACAEAPTASEEQGGTQSDLIGDSANSGINKARVVKKPAQATPAPAQATPAPEPEPAQGDPGTPLPVLVTWNAVANSEASLDVVMNDGKVIGPCIAVDILRAEFQSGISDGLGYLFTGDCRSANTSPAPANIRAFRICTAVNNDWANGRCTESAPWNHTNAAVHIDNR